MSLTRRVSLVCFTVLCGAVWARADLAAINKEKLPQDPALLRATAEIAAFEPMVDHWSAQWNYSRKKKEVAAAIERDLQLIRQSSERSPENEELLLLLGLVAHYSYNLDSEPGYMLAVDSFNKAQRVSPQDYRPEWFLAQHQCQSSSQLMEGMKRLLALENARPWRDLPAAFWDDYLQCALVSNMPVHGVRAGKRAAQLSNDQTEVRKALMESLEHRLVAPDPKATYPAREVWAAENSGDRVIFTASLFGLRFSIPGSWQVRLGDVNAGIATGQFGIGPYRGKSGDVVPNILIVMRPPKPHETLEDFVATLTRGHTVSAISPSVCPVEKCIGGTAVTAGGYQLEGDAHMVLTAFARQAPEYPGLLFEQPVSLPPTPDSQTHFFRAGPQLQRLPGTLYYLVLVDTASSVADKAKQDYTTFMQHLEVE